MSGETFAVFDMNDHAIAAGWATYHEHVLSHPHIHAPAPDPANGHAPSNYARCACGVFVKWFVVGQHRYGSIGQAPEVGR
jgi:hypothetical protein